MDLHTLEIAAGRYRTHLGSELVDLLLDIWANQMDLTPDITWTPTSLDEMRQAFANGAPMLSVDTPQLDRDWFVESLDTVIEVIGRHPASASVEPSAIFRASLAAIESDDLADAILDPKAVVERLRQRLGLNTDLDKTLLTLAVGSTLQPFAAAVASLVAIHLPTSDLRHTGSCPICGSDASIGVVTEDDPTWGGKRFLWCSTCDTQWRYPRVQCVRCGNTNQESLHYYYDESDPGHRIHVCDSCSGSIAIAHAGLLRYAVVPRVEEFAMLSLHSAVLAEREVGTLCAGASGSTRCATASQTGRETCCSSN